MARGHRIDLATRSFDSKSSARDWVRSMIAKGRDFTDEEHADLLALVRRHPEARQKIGVGVTRFYADRVNKYGTRGLFIEREDGTGTDFSYITCLRGTHDARRDWLSAARDAIRPAVYAFKKSEFESGRTTCAISGARMCWGSAHVDHAAPWPFSRIASEFLRVMDLTPGYDWLSKPSDNQFHAEITDEKVLAAWVNFHDRFAVLQLVDETENLRKGNRA